MGVKMAGLTEKIMEVNQKLEARGVRNAGSDVGKEGKGKGLEGRLANMKKAFAALDKRQKRLKGKIYALQQEMLRDIVGAADVVSFGVPEEGLKLMECRFARHVLRRRHRR